MEGMFASCTRPEQTYGGELQGESLWRLEVRKRREGGREEGEAGEEEEGAECVGVFQPGTTTVGESCVPHAAL